MKRIVSATNTSGISAAPAVEDVIESKEQGYMKSNKDTKKIVATYDYEITKEELQEKAVIAEDALKEFRAVAKRYKGIYDHMAPSEFKVVDQMLEILQDIRLGAYITYSDEDAVQ